MEPSSLAEATEALGMRVQLEEMGVDKFGTDKFRSRIGAYDHGEHAWTGDQYDMSNEKTWRKASFDITGYESKRFFDGKSALGQSTGKGGDKMVDTLV